MKNPYDVPLKIIGATNEIPALIKKQNSEEQSIQIFVALVLSERLLDRLRIAVPPGSAIDFPEEKRQVEDHLNRIRNEIWKIIEGLDQDKVKNSLKQVGEDLKLRFIKKG